MTLCFTYENFDYPAFVNGGYESNDSLNALADTNVNSVSLSLAAVRSANKAAA